MTTTPTNLSDVPPPADATVVYDWRDIGSPDGFRPFDYESCAIGEPDGPDRLEVVIVGNQLVSACPGARVAGGQRDRFQCRSSAGTRLGRTT